MDEKKLLIVLSPMGENEGTKAIEKMQESFGGKLQVVVGRNAEEIGEDNLLKADGLIFWWAFRDTAKPVFLKTTPGKLKWVHSIFAGIGELFLCLFETGTQKTTTHNQMQCYFQSFRQQKEL